MSLRERHGFWQLIHSPSLKDGRWRPKPGSKFDNVKSPRPVSRADAASSQTLFSQLRDNLESDDDVARKIADKLVLMAQEFQSLSDPGSSDHDAGSSDYTAVSDDDLIDP